MASVAHQRRRFLKAMGAGAAALPFYKLLESSVVEGQSATRPLRLLMLYSGFGGAWKYMRPPNLTANDALITPEMLTFPNSVLEPLKGFSNQMMVIEGLSFTSGLIPLDPKDPIASRSNLCGHNHSSACFTTGSVMKDVAEDSLPISPSLEYYLGQKLGGTNAVRSMQIGIGCEAGVTFYDSLSFNESGKRLPGLTDPKAAYKQLFANYSPTPVDPANTAAAQHKQQVDQSVVSAVKASADRLRLRLAGPERAKLDEHLAALADIESRLAAGGTPVSCGTPTAPIGSVSTDGSQVPQATKLHFDVLTQAFACDRTRFAVGTWGVNVGQLPWLFGKDVDDMHNQIAHVLDADGAEGETARVRVSKLQNWYAARIAELMTRFAATPDGDGTLLDNTLIVWAQDFGQDVHGGVNVPYVLLGGVQKKFRMGRYLTIRTPLSETAPDYVSFQPNNKLLVSILNAYGIQTDTFGSPEFKGPLTGLV